MWPLALLAAAVVSAALWYRCYRSGRPDRYRLGPLALIFSGAAVMFLVDSAFTYAEDGVFVEYSLEALGLSSLLVAAGIALWLLLLLVGRLSSRTG